jgi:5-methylcytosine-specific restriction endonuclease McrA
VREKPTGRVGRQAVYCSIRCRSAAQGRRNRGLLPFWDRSPRTCKRDGCAEVFTPRHEHHIFHSVPCRKLAENAARYRGKGSSNYYRTLFVEERGGACEHCGVSEGLEIHHVVSVAGGGEHRATNVLVLCEGCHDKAERSLRSAAEGMVVE